MRQHFFIAVLSVVVGSSFANTANAQFDYDLGGSAFNPWTDYDSGRPSWHIEAEYEVWATDPKPLWLWSFVLEYEDGSEVAHGGYYSQNDAARALLRAFDYDLIDFDGVVGSRFEKRNGRRPQLMDTFDSLAEAEVTERWLDAFGWNPEIRIRWRAVWR